MEGYVTESWLPNHHLPKFMTIEIGLQISMQLNTASPSIFAYQPTCEVPKLDMNFRVNMKKVTYIKSITNMSQSLFENVV